MQLPTMQHARLPGFLSLSRTTTLVIPSDCRLIEKGTEPAWLGVVPFIPEPESSLHRGITMQCKKLNEDVGAESGFTLIELLVAVTILTVGILSVGQILAVSTQNTTFGRTETMAVNLAREIEEKILCESFDQVEMIYDGVDTAAPGTLTDPCRVWAQHVQELLGDNGRGLITVHNPEEDAELQGGMLSILVEMTWKGNGNTYRFPLQFAVTQMGR